MIEEKELKKVVGEVIKYDVERNLWMLDLDGRGTVRYTDEALFTATDLEIGKYESLVYRPETHKQCSHCNSKDVFYDQETDEYYCGVCG